jgi:hypothetical protein
VDVDSGAYTCAIRYVNNQPTSFQADFPKQFSRQARRYDIWGLAASYYQLDATENNCKMDDWEGMGHQGDLPLRQQYTNGLEIR